MNHFYVAICRILSVIYPVIEGLVFPYAVISLMVKCAYLIYVFMDHISISLYLYTQNMVLHRQNLIIFILSIIKRLLVQCEQVHRRIFSIIHKENFPVLESKLREIIVFCIKMFE